MARLFLGEQDLTPLIMPGVGDDTTLWLASAKNPQLVGNYYLTINLQNDTSYSTMTPSTSEQTLLAGSQASLLTDGPTLDMAHKRYLIIEDFVSPITYSTTPSGIAYTTCVSQKYAYTLGRRFSNPTTQNTALWNNVMGNLAYCYYNASGTQYVSSNSYGIYCGQTTPTLSGSLTDTPVMNFPNPPVRYRSNSGSMDTTAWQNVDASATNIKIRWQVYAIDIPCESDVVAKLCKDSAMSGDFTDNLIYLGDL